MTRKSLFIATMIGLMLASGSIVAQSPQISVSIVDPDFEVQSLDGAGPIIDPAGCGIGEWGHVAGWSITPLIPGAAAGVVHWTCDDGASSSNVAFLQGVAIDQVLTEVPSFGVYVLQFDVANWYYSYSGDWKAELYQGNSPAPFCSASGWAMGDMKRQTVTCTLPGGFTDGSNDSMSSYGQGTGNIRIHIQNGVPNPALGGHAGWPILLDNISLTFTPQS